MMVDLSGAFEEIRQRGKENANFALVSSEISVDDLSENEQYILSIGITSGITGCAEVLNEKGFIQKPKE